MKKILLLVCVVALGLTVTAQQAKTNGNYPSNIPVLKEASQDVLKPTIPTLRSAANTIFSEDFDLTIIDERNCFNVLSKIDKRISCGNRFFETNFFYLLD